MSAIKKIFEGVIILVSVLLTGCVYGPLYPWAPCPPNGPFLLGCYPAGYYPANPCTLGCNPNPCTSYHPNYYYRCHNNKCTNYSPYAPNTCDPFPYYTNCKYAICNPQVYTTYF